MRNNTSFLSLAATTAMALTVAADDAYVSMPIHIAYTDQPKVLTNIRLPYPPYDEISAVYDQGSPDFWIFESNSTMNWGCRYLACQGHCNVTVPEDISYDRALALAEGSQTAVEPWNALYGYGGGLYKMYKSDKTINDTFTFVTPGAAGGAQGAGTKLENTQVALAQYLQQRIYGAEGKCTPVPTYSNSILGLSPRIRVPPGSTTDQRNTTGPSFRGNLRDGGKVGNLVQSLWFEKAPEYKRDGGIAGEEGIFTGVGLLGGLDTSKYAGKLVRIPWSTQKYTDLAYYTNAPNMTVVSGTAGEEKRVAIENNYAASSGVDMSMCMIDSGTYSEFFNPANLTQFLEATGLVHNEAKLVSSGGKPAGQDLSWPGKCATVPEDVFMEYEFIGTEVGADGDKEKVQIKIPLRSYQHYMDPLDEERGWCTMSMGVYGCTLGSTFAAGTFWAADDENMVMAIAQGGVAERGSGVDAASVIAGIP